MRLKTKETSLGHLRGSYFDQTVTVSPDSRSVAWVEEDPKGKQRVVRDAAPGKLHHGVGIETGLRFCPRGRRLAYAASEKSLFGKVSWKVNVDDKEGSAWAGIAPGSLTFSPDSQRLAYAGVKADGLHVVLDGVEDPLAFELLGRDGLVFSRNGRRLAWVGSRGKDSYVVVDGKQQGPWAVVSAPTFSPDGKRFAFGAFDGRESYVVVDGLAGPPFDDVSFAETLGFSADSAHVAYAGRRADNWCAVVDGEMGPPLAGVGERFFQFAAGGELVCDVRHGERRSAVRGEQETAEYADFAEHQFAASPDRQHFAWVGLVKDRAVVIVDGKEQAAWEAADRLRFSPDGKRLGHAAQAGGRWHLVMDGTPGPAWDALPDVRWSFSPDSQRFAYVGEREGKAVIVVGDQETAPYDSVCGYGLEFEAPGRLRTLVRRGDEILRVEIAILE